MTARSGGELKVHALIASLTWGGAEAALAHLAQGCGAAGIRLSVGYLLERDGSPAAAALRRAGVEPVLVGVRSLLRPADLARVRRHVAAAAPDVLHTHLGYADLMGGVAARSLGVPAVATIHVMQRGTEPRERLKDALMALARRRCARRVIAVSDAGRDWYLRTGWDVPERVVTVRNGVAAAPAGDRRALRAELGATDADVLAAMVTVLRPGKGHDVAAAAVAAVRARHPRLRLVVFGDGPGRAAVERALAPLGRAAVMAGYREDVAAALSTADVLLHPTHADALPSALMEAMAVGLPVIATAVGGIPEIVADGVTGVLVPAPPEPGAVAGALESLVGDATLRARLGAAGRERYEREFTAQAWARRLRDVYEGILAA